ncbi:hypothetical protein AMTR_s00002p00150230 [Amborella trichopoda]|uniref:Uncharacterized protein n=1 Tax=Amborella trichopoda TaxID=13333 RepID=W1P0F6_AMBTC|nr:hypothetical protein AMTR_s00002p00150230 [Amborella trichopoda]
MARTRRSNGFGGLLEQQGGGAMNCWRKEVVVWGEERENVFVERWTRWGSKKRGKVMRGERRGGFSALLIFGGGLKPSFLYFQLCLHCQHREGEREPVSVWIFHLCDLDLDLYFDFDFDFDFDLLGYLTPREIYRSII